MPTPFKRCGCGATYDVERWRALPRVGIVDPERDYPPGQEEEEEIPPFELRICGRCGSTIASVVPYAGGTQYPPKKG